MYTLKEIKTMHRILADNQETFGHYLVYHFSPIYDVSGRFTGFEKNENVTPTVGDSLAYKQ